MFGILLANNRWILAKMFTVKSLENPYLSEKFANVIWRALTTFNLDGKAIRVQDLIDASILSMTASKKIDNPLLNHLYHVVFGKEMTTCQALMDHDRHWYHLGIDVVVGVPYDSAQDIRVHFWSRMEQATYSIAVDYRFSFSCDPVVADGTFYSKDLQNFELRQAKQPLDEQASVSIFSSNAAVNRALAAAPGKMGVAKTQAEQIELAARREGYEWLMQHLDAHERTYGWPQGITGLPGPDRCW